MKKQGQYYVGIYCWLSKDDIGSNESSSIQSQSIMLEKYVHDNGWIVYDRYIDDGYSGTNYQRPEFQRMLNDIENECINMVVVKDLSRFGRNYLQTGQYTDIYFPDRGVRFVALNDGIDTLKNDNEIAPFKNILNEMYSKDISKKVRSAVRTKKQNGEFLSNYAPYGYQKDPENKNRLIIEGSGAIVVRRMYEMCAGGSGSKIIAKTLDREGILSPLCHRNKLLGKNTSRVSRWNAETVHNILRSRIYQGDMVQGIYDCSQFKRTAHKRKSPEEWIITPNSHEPIVDRSLWEQVQDCLNSRKRVMRTGEIQLFAGFLKCQDCGRAMSYASSQGIPQYTCGHYRRNGKEVCSCHYIRKDMLQSAVLDDIRRHAQLAQSDEAGFIEKILAISSEKEEQKNRSLHSELDKAMARVTELDKIMKRLFEQLAKGSITDSRFRKLSADYEKEQQELEQRAEAMKSMIEVFRQEQRNSEEWVQLIKQHADIKELDRIVLS